MSLLDSMQKRMLEHIEKTIYSDIVQEPLNNMTFQGFHKKVKEICRQKRVRLKKLEVIRRLDFVDGWQVRCLVETSGKEFALIPRYIYKRSERQIQMKHFLDAAPQAIVNAQRRLAKQVKQNMLQSEPEVSAGLTLESMKALRQNLDETIETGDYY